MHNCLQQIFNRTDIEIATIVCEDLGYKEPNFTTAGIYKLHGLLKIKHNQLPWSIIVKVIKSESKEKEDPEHHNYWRREAFIFETRLLEELPDVIKAATPYLVEEQQDGTIWLWMEHVKGDYAKSQSQFDFIARQLGRFNGTYLTSRTVPDQDWICRGWLKSWTTASRKYAPGSKAYTDCLNKVNERSIWTWFQDFNKMIESNLSTLERLPRVLAHQDLSQMNMLLVKDESGTDQVTFIDWQFMSVSGIGEDLAKMFGVNMSLGVIPPDRYKAFQTSMFDSYISGLRDEGWQGDERIPRYGYCLGTALRSIWEVLKYFSLAAQLEDRPSDKELQESIARLEQIIKIQMEMAMEAESLKPVVLC